MIHKATILIFSLFFIININYAAALTCKSGTSSACSSSSAADCVTLGYHAAYVPNCKHYLRCPLNTAYTSCVAFNDDVAPDCSDYPLTACPKNGICQNCPDDATYKKLIDCKSDYHLNNAQTACVCNKTCVNSVVTLPNNAEYKYEECYACGEKSDIISGWKCKDGYQKTSDGTKCELSTCAAGYAKSVDGCGDTGANGWTLGPKDADGCGKCTKKACSGDANLTSVDSCGSSGDEGWNYTSCYYGDELRGTCNKKSCPAGSAVNPACGLGYTSVLTGAPQNTYYSGDDKCYNCTPVPCPDGYSTDISSASDCKAGETYSSSGYSAGKPCGKCTFACPAGYSENITSVKDCGTSGANGWIFTSSNSCGKCTKKACSGNANYTSVASCGSSGNKGWNYTSCYYGDELRGTCTAKTCGDHGYSSTQGEVYQEFDVYLGNSLRVCYENSRCKDYNANYYFGRINCNTWCEDHVPTEAGRYRINEPTYFDDGKLVGNCYTGNPISPTGYNTHDNTCCCAYGEIDPSYCIMGGQGF